MVPASAEGFDIPKERTIIDSISLDEEIQLERDLIEEEYSPIQRAWDALEDRATWNQLMPMSEWKPHAYWHLNIYQIELIKHLVFTGEVGNFEAVGLALGCDLCCFKTAYELHREKWGDYPIGEIVKAMNETDHLFYPKD